MPSGRLQPGTAFEPQQLFSRHTACHYLITVSANIQQIWTHLQREPDNLHVYIAAMSTGTSVPVMLNASTQTTALQDLTSLCAHKLCEVLLDTLCEHCILTLAAVMTRQHRANSCQAVDEEDVPCSSLSSPGSAGPDANVE